MGESEHYFTVSLNAGGIYCSPLITEGISKSLVVFVSLSIFSRMLEFTMLFNVPYADITMPTVNSAIIITDIVGYFLKSDIPASLFQ